MPYFICPNCKQRSIDHDRVQELDNVPVACERCGFGFLFELMDDYYPAPNAGFVVCDREGRILASGRGVFELSGFTEAELLGREVVDGLGLSGFEADRNPVFLSLEWGVRRLGERLRLRTRVQAPGRLEQRAIARAGRPPRRPLDGYLPEPRTSPLHARGERRRLARERVCVDRQIDRQHRPVSANAVARVRRAALSRAR